MSDIYDYGYDNSLNKETNIETSPVVYDPVRDAVYSAVVPYGGDSGAKTLAVGGFTKIVYPGDDIQDAIRYVSENGGGEVLFRGEIYPITTTISLYPNVTLKGSSSASTVLNLIGAANFVALGTDVYTAGTISSIASKINVTGSGTAWLANASTTKQLFLAGQWYKILSITSDTALILAESYRGNATLPGASYRLANIVTDITFTNLKIKGSTGTGISLTDVRNSSFNNTIIESCNKGIIYTNCSQLNANIAIVQSSTSNGVEMTNCGFGSFNDYESIGSGGHGFVLNNCVFLPFLFSSVDSSTNDGWNLTDCDTVALLASSTSNGGIGINLVSGNVEITILVASPIQSNTGDGVKLTGTSDRCIVNTCDIKDNGGYGVNVAASTCDNNIILGNSFSGNTSGAIQDLGINTVIKSNTGVALRDIKEQVRMKNNSGAGVVLGDICVFNAVAAGDQVSTTTTAASNLLLRGGGFMALETIANAAYGRFLIRGFTNALKVNGVTDIAVGDPLTTFTTAGISRKAATNEAYYAIALEAYTVDDSLGVIDAVLVSAITNVT